MHSPVAKKTTPSSKLKASEDIFALFNFDWRFHAVSKALLVSKERHKLATQIAVELKKKTWRNAEHFNLRKKIWPKQSSMVAIVLIP
jgi:hypothetical protein